MTRYLLVPLDATPAGTTKFGDFFTILGVLHAPNGAELQVKTVWMREHLSGATRFITLLPARTKRT